MIKNDLVVRIAARFDISQRFAGEIVQAVFDDLTAGLVEDARVELRRFGSFTVKHQKARMITLPSGQKIKRPAQRTVTFTPSPHIKKQLNPPTRRRKKTPAGS